MADESYENILKKMKATDIPSIARDQVALYIQRMYDWHNDIYAEFKNDPGASKKLHGHIDYMKDIYADFTADMVSVVWFSCVFGDWKALCDTTVNDGKYYEVTFDSSKGVCYVDEYAKKHHMIQKII